MRRRTPIAVTIILNAAAFYCASFPVAALAEYRDGVTMAAEDLSSSLKSLKDSADKLTKENTLQAARNQRARAAFKEQQLRLQHLIDTNAAMNKNSDKMTKSTPARERQIASLEKDLFQINTELEHLGDTVKASKESIDSAKAQDGPIAKQLDSYGFKGGDEGPNPAKEKLRLLKMVYESKQRQQELYVQISDIQKKLPFVASTVAPPQEQQATLEAQARGLQEDINRLNHELEGVGTMSRAWSPDEMAQLEAQVESLQKSHDELDNLVGRMQQKTESMTMTPDQRNDQNRLRTSLDDLGREGRQLKSDLQALRSEMVVLDKRKTFLDNQLRK